MIKSTHFPRVLVVNGGPFERKTNHGIVMSSLFQDWPKDRLAQIDFAQTRDPEFDVCNQYWRVTRAQILKCLMGRRVSGIVKPSDYDIVSPEHQDQGDKDLRTPFEHWLRKNVSSIQVRTAINEIFFRLPAVLSRPLQSWIDRFQPDLVFTMPGNGAILHANIKISKKWNIPCASYFTDDWISWLYKEHFLGFWLRKSLECLFHEFLAHSPISFAISTEMAEEYSRNYEAKFIPILFPYDPPTSIEQSQPHNVKEKLRFVYIGGFEPDRWRSLQAFGKALARLNDEGFNAELQIYTFPEHIKNHGEKVTIAPVSQIMGTATPAEVPGIQQSADVLVHVESFNPQAITKTRLSFSTKIPQYLFKHKCILAFGPANVASMQYFSRTQSAFTVTDDDPERLVNELRKLISDKPLREMLADNSLRVAQNNHDGPQQRERLRCSLNEICEIWNNRIPKGEK